VRSFVIQIRQIDPLRFSKVIHFATVRDSQIKSFLLFDFLFCWFWWLLRLFWTWAWTIWRSI